MTSQPSGIFSLCERCIHTRVIQTGKGSRFLLCQRSRTDPRYPKYPPQPIRHCPGHELTPTPGPDR